MKTRDQKFAEQSYNVVSKRINDPKTDVKEYKSFARRFPTLIHTCGLMQAMAFAQKDDKKTPYKVLEDFITVLKNLPEDSQVDLLAFVEKCRNMELSEYMHTSRLAMRAAGWIKRQADALIEGDDAT